MKSLIFNNFSYSFYSISFIYDEFLKNPTWFNRYSTYTPLPPRNKALLGACYPLVSISKGLLNPYFWGEYVGGSGLGWPVIMVTIEGTCQTSGWKKVDRLTSPDFSDRKKGRSWRSNIVFCLLPSKRGLVKWVFFLVFFPWVSFFSLTLSLDDFFLQGWKTTTAPYHDATAQQPVQGRIKSISVTLESS